MYEFYVTIVGATQGRFHGEGSHGAHDGWLIGLAYDQPVAAKAAIGSARATAPMLQPVRFTRQWGAASPQFLQALATGEALSEAVFEFVRSTDEGEQQVFHRVTLHGARVVELRPFIDLEAEPSALMPLPPLEEVAIAYAGITVENLASGAVATMGKVAGPKRAGSAAKRAAPARKPAPSRKPARTRR
jgi:type VI secretion system Hcp family effector